MRVLVTARHPGRDTVALAARTALDTVFPSGSRQSGERTAVVVEFDRPPRPATVVARRPAKELELRLRGPASAGGRMTVRARGALVFATVRTGPDRDLPGDGAQDGTVAGDRLVSLLNRLPAGVPVFVVAPPPLYRELLEREEVGWDRVLIGAGPPGRGVPSGSGSGSGRGSAGPDPVAALAALEARQQVDRVEVAGSLPDRRERRLALAGRPDGGHRPAREPGFFRAVFRSRPAGPGEGGQATPLVLGAVWVLILGTVVLVMLGGAITGKARGQRAVDLAALAGAASMRDDLPRLVAPPTLPGGAPNPYHLPKPLYLLRARRAAVAGAAGNGASMAVAVRFPDAASPVPVRVRVTARVRPMAAGLVAGARSAPVWAEARLAALPATGLVPAVASGGGYSGPLAERQGRGMRPDVAAAFDAMAAAAATAGIGLAINSAFRSDAEQARLFAANPDPRMVARPGTSLHRCGTELDLGPPSAYAWLAANAGRFGFVQRYGWEPWHFGATFGPAPCSASAAGTGNRAGRGQAGADPGSGAPASLPGFVPARFRAPILRAAARWNVSATLLAAQLQAESNFRPDAVSPAGARGIAQFMPGTAAAYGLRDPFDPVASIMAQARLMSELLRQFGSPALALAAYNAGPGAVAPCRCIPPYAETRAYVARILAVAGGAGAVTMLPTEIELVA